jgi:2-polyprenyl-3-methyl-5-hydroxy-6-metoxy-1,4-benzoquinol methylase
MQNPNRDFDKTHLSVETAAERVMFHRDYIAHLFRWTHVIKHLYARRNYQTAKIIDIGCGKEVPLARALYSNKMSGASYCGIDMNKLVMPEMLQKAVDNGKLDIRLISADATELTMKDLPWRPNIVTSFEAFEHMHPAAALQLVRNAYEWLEPDGHFFFSTPCWNGKAAANHINETSYEALGAILEREGFYIEDHYGTFASISDYKHQIEADGLMPMYERLRQYYDTNLLAAIIAPLYPQYSRNVHWVCRKQNGERKFKELAMVASPYSQHPNWRDLRND